MNSTQVLPVAPRSVASTFTATLLANGHSLPCQVRHARSFVERGRGLLGHARLLAGQALWITPCPSIHTVGMTYAIDVVFLNRENVILRVAHHVLPCRFRLCRGATSVIEMLSGQARVLGLHAGQELAAVQSSSPVLRAGV